MAAAKKDTKDSSAEVKAFKAELEETRKALAEALEQIEKLKEKETGKPAAQPKEKTIKDGHEYVDLGLPSGLKWATCNVGASKPEDYGDYFAWGEIVTKDTYTMEKILSNSGNYSGKQLMEGLVRNGIINYDVVNFARGKTYDNALILINEAENYSKEEMLLLLTRIGENSKIIISGDVEQMDRKDLKTSQCGMVYALEKLKDMEEVDIVEFFNEDIVRHPIIGKIINRWKK